MALMSPPSADGAARTGRLHTALDRCDRLILEAFGNDNGFMHSVNEAFETFVNMSPVS